MRPLIPVLDQISTILQPVTPVTPQITIVNAGLDTIRKQAAFYPPEAQLPLWTELGAVLYRQFGSFNPMPPWALEISKVVAGS